MVTVDYEKVDKIYDKDLTYDEIMKNPILKPVFEVNTAYQNSDLEIKKAALDSEERFVRLNEVIKSNFRYASTDLVNFMRLLIDSTTRIIHAEEMQKDNLKKCIVEMISICKIQYAPVNKEEEKKRRKEIEEEEKKYPKEAIDKIAAIVHSEFLGKDIPIKEEKKKEEKDGGK